jgi:hypothetical protein
VLQHAKRLTPEEKQARGPTTLLSRAKEELVRRQSSQRYSVLSLVRTSVQCTCSVVVRGPSVARGFKKQNVSSHPRKNCSYVFSLNFAVVCLKIV